MIKTLAGLGIAFAGIAGSAGCGGSNTPTAAATATPAPSPTPTATPSPAAFVCNLPAMPDCSAPEGPAGVFGCCRRRTDELGEFVDLAIRDVQASRPELFNRDFIRDSSQAHVIVELVARRIEQRFGVCARQVGPEDEIGVKRGNDFSEQFDIILGDGVAVNPFGYTVTCRPARF